MLTRRHLRIKTMQALYAYVQSDLNDAQLGLRRLEDSIKAINDLYLYELRIFWHFNHFLEERLEIEQAKQFPNRLRDAQLQHFLKLPFLVQLVADDAITKAWEQHRIHWGEATPLLRGIFFSYWTEWGETLMWNSPELQVEEVQITHLRQFYRDFLANNEDLQQHYEAISMHWSDDLDAAQMMTVQTMQNARKNRPVLVPLIKNQEDMEFATELFVHTLRNQAEWQERMAAKAKQWDFNRMAPVDRSIVQMALSEVVAFPQIPVKVSIDEAIELAKQYGSPKAASFVNGILDAVVGDLKSEGRIQKLGRGLIGS
jgi:transcription antitermination protein NusB